MTVTTVFRVADLPQNRPTAFDIEPDAATLQGFADELGLSALRKLRFSGEITAQGKSDWVLSGRLGATVIQPCVVTLEPVTTRIDTDVRRIFSADFVELDRPETEIPEDETVEPLGAAIDAAAVMVESLALAVPLYPRKDNVEITDAVFTEPGKKALRDEDLRPFSALADLRKQMKKSE